MKLVSYKSGKDVVRCGLLTNGLVYDAYNLLRWADRSGMARESIIPQGPSMMDLLMTGESGLSSLRKAAQAAPTHEALDMVWGGSPLAIRERDIRLTAPIQVPRSLRDFYSFEAHVKKARSNRGLDMVPEWYSFPVFYFSNHNSIKGPGEEVEMPAQTEMLDYELEVACVIGKKGRDISVGDAEGHIAGYMIMNDWSARDLQAREMKVGLGPAKGKDFATSLGPCLVTPDELEDRREGDRYRLSMEARVNGEVLSRGNLVDIHWTFPQMVARASESTWLFPGDVLGSGTVGTGCLLELGAQVHPWLQPGDLVELKVERLGILTNRITRNGGR